MNIKIADFNDIDELYELNKLFANETSIDEME
jgi:hypothetical protein